MYRLLGLLMPALLSATNEPSVFHQWLAHFRTMSLDAFKRFPVRTTEDLRGIASRFMELPPMLLWVDQNDNDTNTRIENAIKCVTHLRKDDESTTLLRCRPTTARSPDVWTQPRYCLQASERVTLLRMNAHGEQDFAFVRTATGVEGFVLVKHLANPKGTKIKRVASTAEALAAIQGELQGYISLPPSKFRVMTNNVRMEDGTRNFNAGSQMAHAMRLLGYSGPILVFCGDVDRASGGVAREAHVLLTSDEETALRYATFDPVHRMYSAAAADSMFPDFDALEAEGTRIRTVSESEVIPHLQTHCDMKKLSSSVTAQLGQLVVEYRKFFIPRSAARLANDSLQSHIFHCIEDLVMQYVDVRSSAPVIQRVIAIDNPTQRERFCTALKQSEGRGSRPWPTDATSQRSLNLLRLAVPNISEYPNACPALVFHATHDHAEKVICSIGFRMEFLGQATGNDGWYGRGFYFSTVPAYCHHYQPKRAAQQAAGSISIVAAWVLVGRPHVMHAVDIGCPKHEGSDSHYAIVHGTHPIAKQGEGIFPDGDEIVIFDADAVLPQFVIELSPAGQKAAVSPSDCDSDGCD